MQSQMLIYSPFLEKSTENGCIPSNQPSQKTWLETATQFKTKQIQKSSKIHKAYYS